MYIKNKYAFSTYFIIYIDNPDEVLLIAML